MPWKAVLRDVVLIWVLTSLGGLVVGFAVPRGSTNWAAAVSVSSFVFATAGFTISGCLVRVDRFRHLSVVAGIVWLSNTVMLAFIRVTDLRLLIDAIALLLAAAVGGGISLLIVRPTRENESVSPPHQPSA